VNTYVGKLHGRGVFDPQDDARLLCCWDTCERYGTTLFRVRIYEGVNPAAGMAPIYSWKIFCSEGHKMYYVNAPQRLNYLPPGFRLASI
jgi:hypothetical protein